MSSAASHDGMQMSHHDGGTLYEKVCFLPFLSPLKLWILTKNVST